MSITRLGRSDRLDEGAGWLDGVDRLIHSCLATDSELVASHPVAALEDGQRRILGDIDIGSA